MIPYDLKSALLKSRQAVSFIYYAEPKNGVAMYACGTQEIRLCLGKKADII